MNESEALALLEEHGGVIRGHFRLSSGRHSDVFAQKFRVLERPDVALKLGQALADRFAGGFDVVACPAVGAVVLGFTTALAGRARFVFAERSEEGMTFRRGFRIEPSERVLVVEDVVTTGGSAREVIDLVARTGASIVGLGVLVDRADASQAAELGAPMQALVRLTSTSWEPASCPLCAEGVAIDDPGSRRL